MVKVQCGRYKKVNDDINWNFNNDVNSVEGMWEEMYSKLKLISNNVPKVDIKIAKNGSIISKSPWDCTALKRKRKLKDKAWKTFENVPTSCNLDIALSKQTDFDRKLSGEMIRYEKKITSNMKTNPKGFYAYVNSKRKVRESVVSVKNDRGELASSPEETAELLADFFESTFINEPFGPLPKECYNDLHTESIPDYSFHKDDVKDALLKLDVTKAMGPDTVHPKVLKCLGNDDNFVESLTQFYNVCYTEGKIPFLWKTAHVTALHKKGPKNDASNYRPISLTSILCKIYEKFIRNHLIEHVARYISPQQHGFVSAKSCLSNLLESMDIINDMISQGEDVDVFYLDFQKAFDTVPHSRLITKLQNYGITGKTLDVIADFLSGRSFTVRVGNSHSKYHDVTSGVPQGSVLGPLLFVLYVNDLPEGIRSSISLFADDVKMYAPASSVIDTQMDIDRLHQWQLLWLLKFNTTDGKCKVMHAGINNPHNNYYLDGILLPTVDSEKDLGVYVNSKLDWSDHIAASIKKANACISWISRTMITRDASVMINLYKSLVRPHLEYCV